ncbi:Phosphoesterase PA-phosphatase [Modestobacter italicus]|uniref:Phosphoesterase PA-phosphatase n=1 Tax=Modestobacter italicus (strain DSM 44449 / CECT 9708 / BC 501) TaxID=2732864 RepID=I4EV71_MODI5|nr:phosphatase PAP2 family protein [Modestobacter marinus]CCH87284.1 Phosphoesterase PA-phosphatase [Modestobacter marinus]
MQTALPGQTRSRVASVVPAWLAVGGSAVVVALLAWAVLAGLDPLLDADRAVSDALYAGDGRSRWLELVLQVATAPGLSASRAVVLLPVLAWLVLRRAGWTAAWVFVAAAGISPLTTLLKDAVGRLRPQFADGGAGYASFGYPSGHASGIAALVTILLVLAWPLLEPPARRAWLAVGAALVLLVGLTRIWLGVHYLSDVLGGWALGLGWTLLVALLVGALPGHRAALRPREI